MCGICGIFNFAARQPASREALERAAAALRHRGPDDEGFYLDGELGLGNRRLSIIDLAGGHQPLSNEDASLWLTFNGEIYNYRELRAELELEGHRFRSATDTETILHLYERDGPACVECLCGMFAFALWDARARRLMLARDRLGIKPLFYHASAGTLSFASELRALFELTPGAARPQPDLQSIYDFLVFRYVPSPGTMYCGVEKLLPGHYLLVDESGIRTTCYWDVPHEEETPGTANGVAGELLSKLGSAVESHLVADVPVGVFLSGGTDSSAIVALMARLGAWPLRTFSVGFPEADASELPWARQVAVRYGTIHEELVVEAEDVARDLQNLIALRAEPVAEPTDLALYGISKLAARSVKVALAGEGGDELLAGYPKYAFDSLAGLLSLLPGATRALARALPRESRRARLALNALAVADPAERLATWFASFSLQELGELFLPELLDAVDPKHPARVIEDRLSRVRTLPPLKRMLYVDLKVWLPDNLLLRGDQMTMAASLEERVPFLDHRFVEFAFRIPARMLAHRFRAKALFKRALGGILPAEILHRRKVGFSVPVGAWFRGPLKPMVSDLLLLPGAQTHRYFTRSAIERIVQEHSTGRRDCHKQLWTLVNFELWARQQGGL